MIISKLFFSFICITRGDTLTLPMSQNWCFVFYCTRGTRELLDFFYPLGMSLGFTKQDLGPKEIAQLVSVDIALPLVLAEPDSDNNANAVNPNLPHFVIPVLEKMLSSQEKWKEKHGQLYWRHRDLNMPGRS